MVQPAVSTDLIDVLSTLGSPFRILYKRELDQPSGSFKLRGMSELILESLLRAQAEGKSGVHVYTSSGGNAGIAAAYASKHHGVPCTVVLPVLAKQASLDKLHGLGAEVVVHGAHWGEADAYLQKEVIPAAPADVFPIYCHPFDNDTLWSGHAHMVDEIPAQLEKLGFHRGQLKAVVCSVGGGGLYNGIVTGLRRNGWLDVPVIAVETNQTPTLAESAKAGEMVTLREVRTISTSLGAPYIAQKTWDFFNSHPSHLVLVDDADASSAVVRHFDRFGEIVEPACGASLVLADNCDILTLRLGPLGAGDAVVVIVCGGTGTTAQNVEEFRATA